MSCLAVQPGGKLTMLSENGWANPTISPNQMRNGRSEDRVNGALYYFCHGLSYTTFTYRNLKISPPEVQSRVPFGQNFFSPHNIDVSFEVKNTGSREGDEVIQLYTHQLVTSVTTYEKNLRHFGRIHLKPGESMGVHFFLGPDAFALWNRDMHFVTEPGTVRVMIGSSSEDIRLTGEFTIRP